jgi:DNA polymerase III subunit delta'
MAFTPKIALDYLRRAQERERLAHAYLITGPTGSGKRTLAAGIAAMVNGAVPGSVFAGSAVDVHLASPESKSRRIAIEQIRALEHALQLRATSGGRKVAIISEADRLGSQAANAFLKTLEEPPKNSLLLLLSTIPELLPDTIVSRCLPLQLTAPNDTALSAEARELLALLDTVALGKEGAGVHEAYQLAQGFQRLRGKMRAGIIEENNASQKGEETHYKQTTDAKNWLETREEHYKALTESVYLLHRAELVEILFLWWADVLRASTGVTARELPDEARGTAAVAARLTTPEILQRIRRYNVQENLALEVAFLKVFRF